MAFPQAFLDELRARTGLAELVGRRVRLVRRGREHTGLCPFHNEKTPSFTVNEDKGFYHCFGCGAHGSAIDFVMQTENLSFPEAVEKLALEAGLEVPRERPEDREREARRRSLYDVMEAAAEWFEAQLAGQIGAGARDYLAGRGVRPQTVGRFRLGYAPERREALKAALLARGFAEAQLVEAGLLIRPEDGGDSYDRFRQRLIFPITDRRGRVVAFGGRALAEQKAKYLNSPETPLFHKGRLLYNLAGAREAVREAGTVLVTEGYMDVIALAEAGFGHAVAPLGTALTEEQMQELWRLAPEPVLCFDGDNAGQRAAFRAAERALPLLKPGHSFRFVGLPPGEDPDSLVRGQGAGAMRALVEAAEPLGAVIWRMATEGQSFNTPERRAGLRQALREAVARIADPVV
ncbi:MAG TPA: DNA primase, partial [Alphaproteobacteria bacterium]|nr:DNA primase [Alphaproteobacteria bacterium]